MKILSSERDVKLRIVYDNEAVLGFRSGWGLSCLIETGKEKVLFDTGWDGNILLWNLGKFGIREEEIEKIVLSHQHWDHIGGLTNLHGKDIEVYVPRSFSEHLKAEISKRFRLREVTGTQKIGENIWTTGELGGEIKEQSLVLRTAAGLMVLTGCAHPGVGEILRRASELGQIYGIVGGMHDFSDYELLRNLKLVVATHCTFNKRKIAELFPSTYIEGRAGLELLL